MLVAEAFSGLIAKHAVGAYPQSIRGRDRYSSVESRFRTVQDVGTIAESDIVGQIVDDMNLMCIVVELVGALVCTRYVDCVFTDAETSGYDGMSEPEAILDIVAMIVKK